MLHDHDKTALTSAILEARGSRSQQAFATAVGTNILTLREWEKGRKVPFIYTHIEALVREGVPLDLLVECARRRAAA